MVAAPDTREEASPRLRTRRHLGIIGFWDRPFGLIRAWWIWLAGSLLLWDRGIWPAALVGLIVSWALYHTTPRAHPMRYALDCNLDMASAEFRATLSGVTGIPTIGGNRVTIYNNGDEFYPAMLKAIESAQYSVTMEQHIFWSGQIGRHFAEAFSAKAREGKAVRLLVDAVGSAKLGEEILEILERGGCQLAWFRPIHWY